MYKRQADTLTDHSLIESVTFYYDDHTYHKLEQFNTDTQKLFLPLSQVSSPWLKHFETTGASQLFVPKVDLSEKEVTEHGPLAYIKPIFYLSLIHILQRDAAHVPQEQFQKLPLSSG